MKKIVKRERKKINHKMNFEFVSKHLPTTLG